MTKSGMVTLNYSIRNTQGGSKMRLLSRGFLTLVLIGVLFAGASPARAAFHLWDIVEIYSNADGTVQFIEFFNLANGEQFLSSENTFVSTDQNQFPFPNDLPSSFTANTSFLVGTQSYVVAPGAVAPDYVVPDNFFAVNGNTIQFGVLPATILDSVTFTDGQLPLDGVLSLNRDGTTGVNSPTNFAGETGSVLGGPTTCVLNLTLTSGGGAVTLNFELGASVPTTANVWVNVQTDVDLQVSVPLPPIVPPVSFPFTIPLSNLGTIGILTTLTTADGIICSDFKTIDTGP